MAHAPVPHHLLDRQAHRARPRAHAALDAGVALGGNVQLGRVQQVAQLRPKHHERGHPADAVAHRPSPKEEVRDEEQEHDAQVDKEAVRVGYRYAVVCLIEGVDGRDATRHDEARDDRRDPRDPDDVLYGVELPAGPVWPIGKLRLEVLQATYGTQPSTPRATQEDAGEQLDAKRHEASRHNAVKGPHDRKIRREVEDGDGKR